MPNSYELQVQARAERAQAIADLIAAGSSAVARSAERLVAAAAAAVHSGLRETRSTIMPAG